MLIATQFYCRLGKQTCRLVRQTGRTHLKVLRRNFHADAVAAPLCSSDVSRASAHERVEYCVPDEAKHANKSFGELKRIRCRMISSGSAGNPGPDLLEPLLVVLRRNHAEYTSGQGW